MSKHLHLLPHKSIESKGKLNIFEYSNIIMIQGRKWRVARGNCPPRFWHNRRRHRVALILAQPALDSYLHPCDIIGRYLDVLGIFFLDQTLLQTIQKIISTYVHLHMTRLICLFSGYCITARHLGSLAFIIDNIYV